nr:MAG TPA: hypothetical protein [Caudoviricetes sp.]
MSEPRFVVPAGSFYLKQHLNSPKYHQPKTN